MKGKIMSKLFYTAAMSLLASSAMAMTQLTNTSDSLVTTPHTHIAAPYLNSYAHESMSELRIVYDEDSKRKPEIFKRDKKKNIKKKQNIREANRRSKYAFLYEATEDFTDDIGEAVSTAPKTSKIERDVVSLLDFALLNKSGRNDAYEWRKEDNDKYITEAIDILWEIKDRHGELPGVAQILLGDLWSIVTREDHDQNVIGLLDNKHPTFTEEDIELLLAGIGNNSPLDVLSLENIEGYCAQNDPLVLYAALLKPYMKYRVSDHSQVSRDDLVQIMKFIERGYQSLDSEERQEISEKLNIMAIFESGLAVEYAETTVYGEFVQQLLGEVKSKEKSVQDAAEALIRQLDYDKTLGAEVAKCVHIMNKNGYESYVWEEDEDETGGSEDATAPSQKSTEQNLDEETDYSDADVEF